MKKLVLFFAVVVAVTFASCGNKQAEAPAEEVADEEVVAEEVAAVVDSTVAVIDSTVTEVVAE